MIFIQLYSLEATSQYQACSRPITATGLFMIGNPVPVGEAEMECIA